MAGLLPPHTASAHSSRRPRLAVLLPLLVLNPHALVRWRGGRQRHNRRLRRHLYRLQPAGREHRPELICLPLPRLSVRCASCVRWTSCSNLRSLIEEQCGGLSCTTGCGGRYAGGPVGECGGWGCGMLRGGAGGVDRGLKTGMQSGLNSV